MKEFVSIETFRHVVASVRRFCTERGKPLPVLTYRGTVKLHGTNAGVRINAEGIFPQKRSGPVSIGDDNAGFAFWCQDKGDFFHAIANRIPMANEQVIEAEAAFAANPLLNTVTDFTLFGEWCGGNIQKNVSICQVPKHFVIFAAYDHKTEEYLPIEMLHGAIGEETKKWLNEAGIYLISQIPLFYVTIDFSKPEDILAKLEEFTLQVEEECPWGKFRGVTGVGEGIVWQPIDKDYFKISDLWFKTKGMKHAAKTGKKATNIQATPEKLESIRAVVEAVLPEWRLEQGVAKLKEDNLPIEPKSTGPYLKWICNDIIKEEIDVLKANNVEWKDVSQFVTREARQWFLQRVNQEVFVSGKRSDPRRNDREIRSLNT